MIVDAIAIAEENIRNLEFTKEAAIKRLTEAGILDKDGNLAKMYRSTPKKKKKHHL